jgi:hypothetical protein
MEAPGFRFCGIADETPRPGSRRSATSATSVCASSTRSPAIFASAPVVTPSAAPSRATGMRFACQGSAGTGRSSRVASPAITAGARSPRTASVPTAPPSWRGSERTARASSACASTTAINHPAAFSPNVVGDPCWSNVRPAMTLRRWAPASAPSNRATCASSAVSTAAARRDTSASALSTTSWLVAPK